MRLSESTKADLRSALWWSWIWLACLGGVLVTFPHLIAQPAVDQWVGICPAKAAGDPCSLCGMTTAFYLIAAGRLDDATGVHYASVPLYSGLALNAVAAAVDLVRKSLGRPR